MRTTVTLEPEVEHMLHNAMRERGLSFKAALNNAVRDGLTSGARKAAKRFTQKTYAMGADPYFRWEKALAVSDALEDEEIARKLSLNK